MTGNPRTLLILAFATALVVGGILLLATDSWLALAVPLVLHALLTVVVLGGFFKRLEQGDKPDPVTEARLDEERSG